MSKEKRAIGNPLIGLWICSNHADRRYYPNSVKDWDDDMFAYPDNEYGEKGFKWPKCPICGEVMDYDEEA